MSGDASQVLTTWPEDMATIPRVADAMASEQSQRITMDKVLRRLYFNLPLTQVLQPQAGTNSTAYREMGAFGLLGRLGYNITRLVVDAAIATVCKRLKCEVTPNGGDFKTERSCRDMSAFVTAIISFLLMAFVIFQIVRTANKMMPAKPEAPAAPAGPSEVDLLTEIRDALKKA